MPPVEGPERGLTHVRRCVDGKWVPITAVEADKLYKHTIPASKLFFLCYCCYHYVTFVKGTSSIGSQESHFRHSSSDQDKNCPDRSFSQSQNQIQILKNTFFAPTRLYLEGSYCGLEIGFLPLSSEELARAERLGAQVKIHVNDRTEYVKDIRLDSFAPHSTTWFRLKAGFADSYGITVTPEAFAPCQWQAPIPPPETAGTLFDQATGKRLPLRADVELHHPYYLLTKRNRIIQEEGIEYRLVESVSTDNGWLLYKVKAVKATKEAALFFYNLCMILTDAPTRLTPLWPPMIGTDHILKTDAQPIWMCLSSDNADVMTYPSGESLLFPEPCFTKGNRVLRIDHSDRTQMVWAVKSSVLRFFYLLPMEVPSVVLPEILVTDENGTVVTTDILTKPPARGILHIHPDVDGKAQVYNSDGSLRAIELRAGVETRLQDLTRGQRILIRQGCDILREIQIASRPQTSLNSDTSPPWRGPKVPFPSRHAWILGELSPQHSLYRRTLAALQSGRIPSDGLAALRILMEEKHHG